MSKWTEENVLYFASKKKFEVDKEASTQKSLRVLVGSMRSKGLLKRAGQSMFKRYYAITDLGVERLLAYKDDYKKSKCKAEAQEGELKKDVRGFHVYFGRDKKGNIVYIGTTIQKPSDRWRWHKHNGKDLKFELHKTVSSKEEMLSLEFELIKKHKPKLNKITNRPQNLNVKLTKAELNGRVGDKEWCQSCLKRRARKGNYCGYC